MSINIKISLFKVYIKPLLYYGAESLDLNIEEDLKRSKQNKWFTIAKDMELSTNANMRKI